MDYKEYMKYLIITIVGFFVVLMEWGIESGIQVYPTYIQDFSIGSEFQYYTLNTFYGVDATLVNEEVMISFAGFRIPIFSDILGFIIILIGCKGLKNRSRVFSITGFMALLSAGMTAVIALLPFVLNGSRLCYVAMALGIAALGLELSVGYFFVCAVCDIISGISFASDRMAIGISWFVTVILRIIVFVTTWVQLPRLTTVYNMFLFWTTVFMIYSIWKIRDYVTGEIVFDCQK